MFPCEFFEIIKGNFFIKHLWASASECWQLEKSSWLLSKISFLSPLWFLILNDSILKDLFIGCKTLSWSFLLKSEGIHQSSQKFLLCYQHVFHVWKGCKSFINICYLHDFFLCSFYVISALGDVMVEIIVSMGVFSIIFLFLLNISWRTVLIKNIFWLTYVFCSFSLLSINLRLAVVVHDFLNVCGNPRL